ncbi:MAG: cobyric acid synthase [Bacteroidaceae bacterium]|nr:cobyric acid synthase [Bacteroidaceae bacterium]
MTEQRLHPVMLVGTGSDVGKSVLATALCRIFLQDGYHPAPFKAQNMALNSYATPEGYEIGRAQAVQAEAARLAPHTDMNPLLLKPNSEHTTQVVLNGKPIGNRSAYDYFRKEGREELRLAVNDAFDRLAVKYNPIVMEGAGSVSEINLRDSDLVNMPMARHADADVILVADIDRGGVFASVYGSIMLQTPEDKARIKGIIINKFRGDLRLFDEGRRMMEELCGVPVLGVVPMFKDIVIEEEDSVELDRKRKAPLPTSLEGEGNESPQYELCRKVQVAVILLRHISNFTDFDILERDERVNLFYTNNIKDIEKADIIILPGTKATLDDLGELRRNGVAQAIIRAHKDGKTVIGICGGYQMLGQMVSDPDGVEGSVPCLPGLGILPLETVMTADKVTQQVEFEFDGKPCKGYEIHQGRTRKKMQTLSPALPLYGDGERHEQFAEEELPLVYIQDKCLGTYVHGILDNPAVIDYVVSPLAKRASEAPVMTAEEFKDRQYDQLAEHVRRYVDINKIYEIIKN